MRYSLIDGDNYMYVLRPLFPSELPFPDGCILRYKLNGDCLDSSGNDNHGIPTSITYEAGYDGKPNGSAKFNGSSSFIEATNSNLLNIGNGSFTISCYAKVLSTSFCGIISKSLYGPESNRYALYLDYPYVHGFVSSNNDTKDMVSAYNLNEWVKIALVIDNTNNICKIYKNGQLETSSQFNQYTDFNSNFKFFVGAYNDGSGQTPQLFFDGNISNVAIFNRALSDSEINML